MNNKPLKFNIVDVFLIIISLIVFTVIILFLFKGGTDYDFSPEKSIYCTIETEKINSKYRGMIKTGDAVFNTETGEKIGTVTDIVYTSSYENVFNSDSNIFDSISYPDLIDAEMVIHITAKETELSQYKVGKTLSLNVPLFAFKATFNEISDIPPVLSRTNSDFESDYSVSALQDLTDTSISEEIK